MVTKDMTIGEVVRNNPGSAEILMSFGMGCVCCPSALGETVEEAAMVHGLDVDDIINALNNNEEK